MIEALTLPPPWDFLVIHAGKNPENRTWPTKKIGWVLIHAAQATTPDDYNVAIETANTADYTGPLPEYREMQRSAITGAVRITGCLVYDEQRRLGMDLRWSVPGNYGFFLSEPIALPPVHCKGARQFWKVPRDVREKILAECDKGGVPLPPELRKMLADTSDGVPVKKQTGFEF